MAALQGLDRHVEHRQMVGHEEGIEPPALQRPGKTPQMREIEVGVREGARVAPRAGMNADRPHERAKPQLPCFACHQLLQTRARLLLELNLDGLAFPHHVVPTSMSSQPKAGGAHAVARTQEDRRGCRFDHGRPVDRLVRCKRIKCVRLALRATVQDRSGVRPRRLRRVPRRQGRLLRERGQYTDRRHPRVDKDGLLIPEAIGVEVLMAGMKCVRHPLQQLRRFEIHAVERHVHLEHLLSVAHVGGGAHLDGARERRSREPLASLGLHRAEGCAYLPGIEVAGVADVRARHLASQVAGEHAPCRQHRREPGHDDPFQIELARNIRDVQRGCSPERKDGKASWIDAAAHGDEPDAFGHMRVDDAGESPPQRTCDPHRACRRCDRRHLRRHGDRDVRARRENYRDRGSRGRGWHPSPSPRCRRGHSKWGPVGRPRSGVRHEAPRCGRRAPSSRRPLLCWRCRGFATPRVGRRRACPRRLRLRRRPPMRCRSRFRPCRRE